MATARLLKKKGKLTKPNNRRLKGSPDKFVGNQRTSIVRKTNNLFLKEKAYVDPNDLYMPPEKIEDTFEFNYVLENEPNMMRRGRAKPITKGVLRGDTFEVEGLSPTNIKNGKAILHPGAERALSIEEALKRSRPFYHQTDLVSTAIRMNILNRSEEQGKSMQSVYDIANKPSIDNQGRTMQGLYGVNGTDKWAMKKGYEWSSLKRGVYTMAKMAGANAEQLNYLTSISPEQYEMFYNQGLLDFDEYFEYMSHGIHEELGYVDLTQANQSEIDKFIAKISYYVA